MLSSSSQQQPPPALAQAQPSQQSSRPTRVGSDGGAGSAVVSASASDQMMTRNDWQEAFAAALQHSAAYLQQPPQQQFAQQQQGMPSHPVVFMAIPMPGNSAMPVVYMPILQSASQASYLFPSAEMASNMPMFPQIVSIPAMPTFPQQPASLTAQGSPKHQQQPATSPTDHEYDSLQEANSPRQYPQHRLNLNDELDFTEALDNMMDPSQRLSFSPPRRPSSAHSRGRRFIPVVQRQSLSPRRPRPSSASPTKGRPSNISRQPSKEAHNDPSVISRRSNPAMMEALSKPKLTALERMAMQRFHALGNKQPPSSHSYFDSNYCQQNISRSKHHHQGQEEQQQEVEGSVHHAVPHPPSSSQPHSSSSLHGHHQSNRLIKKPSVPRQHEIAQANASHIDYAQHVASIAIEGQAVQLQHATEEEERVVAKQQQIEDRHKQQQQQHQQGTNQSHHRPKTSFSIFNSKPLDWSKQYGDKGRKATHQKEMKKMKLFQERAKPPAFLAEDLLDIVENMTVQLLHHLCKHLPMAASYCDQYASMMLAQDGGDEDAQQALLHSFQKIVTAVIPTTTAESSSPDDNSFSSEERRLLWLLRCCMSIPNHRETEDLLLALIWILKHCHAAVTESGSPLLQEEVLQTMIRDYFEPIKAQVKASSLLQANRNFSERNQQRHQQSIQELMETLTEMYQVEVEAVDQATWLDMTNHHASQAISGVNIAVKHLRATEERHKEIVDKHVHNGMLAFKHSIRRHQLVSGLTVDASSQDTKWRIVVSGNGKRSCLLDDRITFTHLYTKIPQQVVEDEGVEGLQEDSMFVHETSVQSKNQLLEQSSTLHEMSSISLSPSHRNREAEDKKKLKNHVLFLSQAPSLSSEQSHCMLLAIVADLMRSLVLQIEALVQHVFGGHEVTSSDLKLLFGSTLGPSVGNANVKALYVWLKANKRSEMHFQPSKFDFLELSLQRIYAMWPSLSIKLSSLDMPSHVEGREGQQEEGEERHSQCEISLHWQSKSQVHRDFQYPEKYRPNINKI